MNNTKTNIGRILFISKIELNLNKENISLYSFDFESRSIKY